MSHSKKLGYPIDYESIINDKGQKGRVIGREVKCDDCPAESISTDLYPLDTDASARESIVQKHTEIAIQHLENSQCDPSLAWLDHYLPDDT